MSDTSFWPIDRTLSSATREDVGLMAMKGYSSFPKSSRLKPHLQMVWYHIQDSGWAFLPLCRDAVGVFYSPSWLGYIYLNVLMCYSCESLYLWGYMLLVCIIHGKLGEEVLPYLNFYFRNYSFTSFVNVIFSGEKKKTISKAVNRNSRELTSESFSFLSTFGKLNFELHK